MGAGASRSRVMGLCIMKAQHAALRGDLEADMAEHGDSSSTLVKAFLPGLILGLIVGMGVGAFITPLLDRNPDAPKPIPGAKRSTPEERDQRPPAPAGATPAPTPTPAAKPAETPADKPSEKPAEKPADKPAEKPAEPAKHP